MKFSGNISFFGTNDLKKTYRFYNRLLNLKLYKDQGSCHIYKISEGGMIGFCNHIKVLNEYHSPIITLLTENVDHVYEKMLEAGVDIEKEPEEKEEFNIYHFFALDPNGYTVEVQKFLK